MTPVFEAHVHDARLKSIIEMPLRIEKRLFDDHYHSSAYKSADMGSGRPPRKESGFEI